jgi:hypothetical protein
MYNRILAIEAEACGAQYNAPIPIIRHRNNVTLFNMYVCSVLGATHTLAAAVFMRDADADEAAATGIHFDAVAVAADDDDDGLLLQRSAISDRVTVVTLCRDFLHSTDALGEAPMHKAVSSRNPLLVACLARVGCSVATLSRDGSTPLALAVRGADVECVKACVCGMDAGEAAFVVEGSSGR